MHFEPDILHLARQVVGRFTTAGHTVVTAESCTAGLVAASLTSVPGSSAVVYGGFVTYANDAKTMMLGVPEDMLSTYGAVSEQAARAMAEGVRERSGADFAVSITGIAGPGGGSPAKPVGLVHFACAGKLRTVHQERRFGDLGRERIRAESVKLALEMLLDAG